MSGSFEIRVMAGTFDGCGVCGDCRSANEAVNLGLADSVVVLRVGAAVGIRRLGA